MAAESAIAVKSCLCGSVQQSPGLVPRVRAAAHKCRICRTKPRFLRSQRSLDLGGESGGVSHSGSPARVTTAAEPMRRRARSAERYDGMRVNTGEQPQPSLELYFVRAPPRQATLPSPQPREEQARSPPPDYSPPPSSGGGGLLPASMLATPASPPPSYEEAERSKARSPPSYEESVAQARPERSTSAAARQHQQAAATAAAMLQQLAAAGAFSPQQQQVASSHACTCSKCQASSSASSRQARSPAAAELRVALPPETSTSQYLRAPGAGALSASSHDQCSCYKCQSRYGGSGSSYDDNDVLLTLETQTAMQGVLTDGVALCSLV